jgi:putative nucleotide binding protein
MVEESAKEEWVRMLTERPPDRDEEESRYVQAVGETGFMLLELVAAEDADLTPGDRLAVEGEAFSGVNRRLTYHTLTQDAQDRLKETIAAITGDNEQRFINWYNNAQPIGLRKHQLDVSPKLPRYAGKRLSRSAGGEPFADFTDLEPRVDSLSGPQALLIERALTKLREVEEARYKLLVN